MKIRNILWQVNGALFDTYPALTYSFSKALNELGFSVALNVIDGLVRQSLDACVDTLSGRFKLSPDLLRQNFVESYRKISPASQVPFPGVHDICQYIHHNGGLNLAFTDTNLESVSGLLEAHHFSGLIDDILFLKKADAEQTYPSLLCAALERHSLHPTEALLISARSLDLQAGRLARVHTCLFGRAERTSPADLQVEKYSQLLDWLTGEDADSTRTRVGAD